MERFVHINESDELYFKTSKVIQFFFWLLLFLVLGMAVAMPLIKVDITVNAAGIIRPSNERTEIKCLQEGVINKISCKNGDLVKKGDLIAELKSDLLTKQNQFSNTRQRLLDDQIKDLELLCKYRLDMLLPSVLKTELYREQLHRVKEDEQNKNNVIDKLAKELKRDSLLLSEKVISVQEFENKRADWQQAVADKKIKMQEQLTQWNIELQRILLLINNEGADNLSIQAQKNRNKILAPVTGYIQIPNAKYSGSSILAGETICTISPVGSLVAECYVSPKDIGLLKIQQPVSIYIDAFDYRYFGFLSARLNYIEPDFYTTDNKQGFKVRCELPNETLSLKNGYRAVISRGQTIQARFVVARRSLWQLLFDNIDDWLKPY